MAKITITISKKEKIGLLAELLNHLDFVSNVEIINDEEQSISEKERKFISGRIKDYKEDPGAIKSWEEVKSDLKNKYGF